VQSRDVSDRNDGRKDDIVLWIHLTKGMIFSIVEGRRLCLRLEASTIVEVPSEEQKEVRPPSFVRAVRRGSRMESNCCESKASRVKDRESFEFPRPGGTPERWRQARRRG